MVLVYYIIDMDNLNELIEKLKIFMAQHDLTLQDVAKKINRDPKTVWLFLHNQVRPHSTTEYRIRDLVSK